MTHVSAHGRRAARLLPVFVVTALLSFSQAASSQTVRVPVKAAPRTPAACASVTGSVRSEGIGYKHLVTLHNGCDKPVECQVWTDVDPEPRNKLRAAPGESVEVITRIGSPASVVTASKECRFL
jgi:hypothetical protein